jgi:hypothetical protein
MYPFDDGSESKSIKLFENPFVNAGMRIFLSLDAVIRNSINSSISLAVPPCKKKGTEFAKITTGLFLGK